MATSPPASTATRFPWENSVAPTIKRAKELGAGLPLDAFSRDGNAVEKEIDVLVRRLARSGLLEYRLAQPRGDKEMVVIEPQMPGYWPQTPKLAKWRPGRAVRDLPICAAAATR